jgi:hypothetical protein
MVMQTSQNQRGLSNQRDRGAIPPPSPNFLHLGVFFPWTSYFLCTPATLIYVIGVVKQGGLHGGHNVSPTNGPMCLTWAIHLTVKDLQLDSTHAVFLNLLHKVDSAILRWALPWRSVESEALRTYLEGGGDLHVNRGFENMTDNLVWW